MPISLRTALRPPSRCWGLLSVGVALGGSAACQQTEAERPEDGPPAVGGATATGGSTAAGGAGAAGPLDCWLPESGWEISSAVAEFGGQPTIRIAATDHCPGNELRTWLYVWRDDDAHELLAHEELASVPDRIDIPLAGAVEANTPLQVSMEQIFGADAPRGAGGMHTVIAKATEPMVGDGALYRMEDSAHSPDPGCHLQGVKFDGTYFYTSCQDLAASEARAFIHDSLGTKVCDFTLGTDYDHPSGILLSDDGAFVGFSKHDVDGDGYAVLAHISAEPCTIDVLVGGATLTGNISSVAAVPQDVCNTQSGMDHLLVYGSLGRSYWECGLDGALCGSAVDTDYGELLDAFLQAPQDCDLYYDHGWLRACIATSNVNNNVHVWSADEVHTDASYWVANGSGETTLPLGGLEHSGGFAFWRTDLATYVLIAPHDSTGSCGIRTPCTGSDRTQILQFLRFEDTPWPSGTCPQ